MFSIWSDQQISVVARLPELRVRILLGLRTSVYSECCVLSGRRQCYGWSLAQRSPTNCGVSECDSEASIMRRPWPNKADSHIACRFHAVPLPCRALIHTSHVVFLPCSDSDMSFVKVRVVAGNIRTASPTNSQIVIFVKCCYRSLQSSVWIVVRMIGMLVITIFVELRVVAGRIQKRAGNPQAVSRRPCCAVAFRRKAWLEHGMGMTWHGRCESYTAALCIRWERYILNP
jgi:hypothetical protein